LGATHDGDNDRNGDLNLKFNSMSQGPFLSD
jgi:hypothetical protein